ncbi:hypothetical protein [Streptomyces sp. NPDC049916]|uniref:hypothetical protein n=1 Tax=Streptomyces sp. NPDC049916 TaxID=3155156 RepID=UPI00344579F8
MFGLVPSTSTTGSTGILTGPVCPASAWRSSACATWPTSVTFDGVTFHPGDTLHADDDA